MTAPRRRRHPPQVTVTKQATRAWVGVHAAAAAARGCP